MKKGIIIGCIFSLIIIIVIYFICQMPDLSPTYTVKEIGSEGFNKHLYLKSKSWGLTNDHTVAVLSTDSLNEPMPDSTKNYIYPGESFIFYRMSNDSLWMYVYSKSKIPKLFTSKIKVIQVELENPDMMKLYKSHIYENKVVTEFH